MKRVSTAVLTAGLVAGLALSGEARAQGVIKDSDWLLRSEFGLDSLRALLNDEAAWGVLVKLSDRYNLWRVSSSETGYASCEDAARGAEQNQPADNPKVFEHSFVFASPKGVTARAYNVRFRSCRLDDGSYRNEALPARFITQAQDPSWKPQVTGRTVLVILKAALEDETVHRELATILKNSTISFIRLRLDELQEAGGDKRYRIYSMEFGTQSGDGGETVLLPLRVTYDAERSEVVEIAPVPRR